MESSTQKRFLYLIMFLIIDSKKLMWYINNDILPRFNEKMRPAMLNKIQSILKLT